MPKFDAYQMVTDRICDLLESGVCPWARPWGTVADCAFSRATGKPYSMLNQMLLADPEKEYTSISELYADVAGEWLTYKQAQEAGGTVRKGEHGRRIVFFKMLEKEDESGEKQKIPYLTAYTVFRVDQCDGIDQKHHTDGDEPHDVTTDQTAESVAADYVRRSGVTVNHVRGNQAYYSPALDTVVLPAMEQFHGTTEYYSTLFHELTHSTGHADRLNRLSKIAAFGSDKYSVEELTAEIGSASILATLGIDTDGSLRNSAAYIKSWLSALRSDKRMIVTAAARAEKAVRMILGVEKESA